MKGGKERVESVTWVHVFHEFYYLLLDRLQRSLQISMLYKENHGQGYMPWTSNLYQLVAILSE